MGIDCKDMFIDLEQIFGKTLSLSVGLDYVYVVLEHHTKDKDARVHGVYTSRDSANVKKKRVESKKDSGYVSILKMKIKDLVTIRV